MAEPDDGKKTKGQASAGDDVWGFGEPKERAAIVEATAEVIEQVDEKAIARAGLRSMEDRILDRSLRIIDSALHFEEINNPFMAPPPGAQPEQAQTLERAMNKLVSGEDAPVPGLPEEWVRELGYAGALRRMRVAEAAWMSAKDAPVGFKIATQISSAIIKARSTEKQTRVALNIGLVQMTAPMPEFETRKVQRE